MKNKKSNEEENGPDGKLNQDGRGRKQGQPNPKSRNTNGDGQPIADAIRGHILITHQDRRHKGKNNAQ
jgi:hypothetical protein